MRKIIRYFTCIVIVLIFFGNANALAREETFTSKVKIHYINAGQSDSELIESDKENILINAGNDDKVYNYLKFHGITKLDYVIATSPYDNSIGNMEKIITNFDIGIFYAAKISTTAQKYNNMINALNAKNIKIAEPSVGKQINIDHSALTFLTSGSNDDNKLNDISIVCRLKCGNNSFMFMGDAEETSKNNILGKQVNIRADVLKIRDTESLSTTMKEFIEKVKPKYAVIEIGSKNDNQELSLKNLDMLGNKDIEIFNTNLNGNIIAKSDGNNIRFYTELA